MLRVVLRVGLIAAASDRHAAWRQDTKPMQYAVVFGNSDKGGLWLAEAPNAIEALATIEMLQKGDEEIKFIRSRQEGEIGIEMLRVLAKEEEEELP